MSRQIELNIGKDLQFIRVNGTLVGGTIGLVLYLLSQLPHCCPHCPLFKEKKWLTLPFPGAARRSARCAQRLLPRSFRTELEQFDAEFFIDFISEKLGPVYYNAGIEEAIRTHLAWSERIQEEMDLKKIL